MARMAASWTCSGAGKSGWPMQKLMMSRPWRASAFTSASTTKAFSVPRLEARRLMSGIKGVRAIFGLRLYRSNIRFPKIALTPFPHAGELRRVPGGPQARRHRPGGDQRLPVAARLLRLGGPQGPDPGGARAHAGRVQA